jgi:hypothetical protein
MKMKMESEKYNKLIKVLRNSKPVLDSTEDIKNEVLSAISKTDKSMIHFSEVIDFLFGWIYIGWVRRGLVTLSVILVLVFIWQQGVIIKQINYLNNQTIITDKVNTFGTTELLEKRILMYKLSGRKFPSGTISVSEKQMNQLLDSVNDLKVKYKDLIKLIEEDPELKKYIADKLTKNNQLKVKL